jgi:F-type H+-transporting ATPase subunit alpha
VQDILRFETELLDHLRRNSKVLTTIRETQALSDDTINELEKVVEHFKKMFKLHTGEPLVKVGNETVQALDAEDVEQEKIVRQKR